MNDKSPTKLSSKEILSRVADDMVNWKMFPWRCPNPECGEAFIHPKGLPAYGFIHFRGDLPPVCLHCNTELEEQRP